MLGWFLLSEVYNHFLRLFFPPNVTHIAFLVRFPMNPWDFNQILLTLYKLLLEKIKTFSFADPNHKVAFLMTITLVCTIFYKELSWCWKRLRLSWGLRPPFHQGGFCFPPPLVHNSSLIMSCSKHLCDICLDVVHTVNLYPSAIASIGIQLPSLSF